MAAIDDLKAQRDELVTALAAARDHKARIQARAAAQAAQFTGALNEVNDRITQLQAKRDRLVQAIRDLTDGWNPA